MRADGPRMLSLNFQLLLGKYNLLLVCNGWWIIWEAEDLQFRASSERYFAMNEALHGETDYMWSATKPVSD